MLIDYLSFSLNFEGITLDYVIQLLGLDKYTEYFEDIGKRSRYEHCHKFGNINILLPYDSRPDMGVLVNMTGQGCRELEQCHFDLFHQSYDWQKFMSKLVREVNLSHKVNVTRIDLAFDDFDGLLDIDQVERKLVNGEYVSRFRKWDKIETCETHSKKESLGKTVYVGSKSSSCYCKFYDKLKEQQQLCKRDEVSMSKLKDLSHWVRFEVTFKDKPAMVVCNTLCFSKEVMKDIGSYINRYFRFVELDDSNISRCTVSGFWERFIGTVLRSKVKIQKSDLFGYDKTYLWFKESLAPSLFALMRTYSRLEGFINDIWQYGSYRLKEHHKLLIEHKTIGRKLSNSELWKLNNPCYNRTVNALGGVPSEPDTAYKPYHYDTCTA